MPEYPLKEIISKRTERSKVFDLGNNKRRLVCHAKPIHYKPKGKTGWEDISLNFQDDKHDNFIADRNKVSIGFRKDLQLYKYFGARYDYEHQFEATIKGIELDGVERVKKDTIISVQRKSDTEVIHQLCPEIEIINRINEISLKNFVKVSSPIEDFKIVEELHLRGLSCSNRKEGNRYFPDEQNKFNFVDEKGELKFWINHPFFEEDSGERSQNISHSLREVAGKLIYVKAPTQSGKDDLTLAQYPILIDTNVYYSSTSDGYVKGIQHGTWDTAHGAATGESVSSGDSYYDLAITLNANSSPHWYQPIRAFFYFDTSNLPDDATVTGATLKIYGYSEADASVSAQEGTQASTLTTADFDACNPTPTTGGGEYGHVSWATGQYNSIVFNATGESNINKTGITKICCRNYERDYLDSEGPHQSQGCYFSEQADTTYDPKLEIDYTEPSTNMQINIGDAWKEVDSMQINIGDVWKDVTGVQQNIGDTWKTVF